MHCSTRNTKLKQLEEWEDDDEGADVEHDLLEAADSSETVRLVAEVLLLHHNIADDQASDHNECGGCYVVTDKLAKDGVVDNKVVVGIEEILE